MPEAPVLINRGGDAIFDRLAPRGNLATVTRDGYDVPGDAPLNDRGLANLRPQVVIIGGGFGGLQTAKRLRRARVDVTLIDRHNYHLFQPLLYQVGTGGLSPANIATPLRAILGRQRNCRFLLGDVVGFELQQRRVLLREGEITYDFLIVAAGARNHYFGNDGWQAHALALKSLEDAVRMRHQIFSAYESAERASDPLTKESLMTFVVVGGGPTGVELAGALAEIARHTLKHDFRRIDPSESKIVLLEAGDHVLGAYPGDLCDHARHELERLGVQVRTQTRLTEITASEVRIEAESGPETIPTRTVLWAAGVAASPLAKSLADATGQTVDRSGRLVVDCTLNLPGHDNVFVIGDMAHVADESGGALPGVAPVAIQQGQYVANLIRQDLAGEATRPPFRYRDRGSMATIGRAAAIAEIGRFKFRGLIAWMLWLVVHLMQIIQFPNRMLILFQWGWNYLTFNRTARIITGTDSVANDRDRPEVTPNEPQAAECQDPRC